MNVLGDDADECQQFFRLWLLELAGKASISPEEFCQRYGRADLIGDLNALIRQWTEGSTLGGQGLIDTSLVIQSSIDRTISYVPQSPIAIESAVTIDHGAQSGSSAKVPLASEVQGFQLLKLLGRGGMGVVYLAFDEQLQRRVALKMIQNFKGDADSSLRLIKEAQAAAQVQHDGIAQVYRIGNNQGAPYFALEYVEGGTLHQRWGHKPQSPSDAASTIRDIALAMQAAHVRGIVHRDLKPQNVLLTAEGKPKVTDFGLAKHRSSELTHEGQLLGTPAYMAPEQVQRSSTVTAAADIYSLGAMLYEALTGRTPFTAPTVMQLLHQVVHDSPVSVRHLQPDVPRDLETICSKCLEKDPARRYESCQAFADDLQRFLTHQPIKAKSANWWDRTTKFTRRNRILVSGIAATFLALTLGATGTTIAMLRAQKSAKDATENGRMYLDEKDRALKAMRQSENSLNLMLAAFRNADEDQLGREVRVVQVLDPAADLTLGKVDAKSVVQGNAVDLSDSVTRSKFAQVLGELYLGLGLYEKALPLFELAYQLELQNPNVDRLGVAKSAYHVASALRAMDRASDGLAIFEPHVIALRNDPKMDPIELLDLEMQLAMVMNATKRHNESIQHIKKTLAAGQQMLGADHEFVRIATANLLAINQDTAASQEQIDGLKQLIAGFREQGEYESIPSINARSILGLTLLYSGQDEEGRQCYQEMIDSAIAKFGPEHNKVLNFKSTLAGFYFSVGQFAESVKIHNELLSVTRKTLGPQSFNVVESLVVSGGALVELQEYAEAEQRLLEAFPGVDTLVESGHLEEWYRLATRNLYGGALLGQGKLELAESYLMASYEEMKKLSEDIPLPAWFHLPNMANRAAQYHDLLGDAAKADVYRDEALYWQAERARRQKKK